MAGHQCERKMACTAIPSHDRTKCRGKLGGSERDRETEREKKRGNRLREGERERERRV